MRNCERCTRAHRGTYGSGRFCAAACAKQVGAARKHADRARRAAAMLPVPNIARPVPLHAPIAAAPQSAASPPRKKAARSESPTTIAPPPPASSALRLRCESCRAPHDGSYASGRFCAVHCARRSAAALKWSKKRAHRAAAVASAANVATSASRPPIAAMAQPPSLPPLPPPPPGDNVSALGKRQRAPLSYVALPTFSTPRGSPPLPHLYAHPQFPPYAHIMPNAHAYAPHPYSHPVVPLPAAHSDCALSVEQTQRDGRVLPMALPLHMPVAVTMANCPSYASTPVQYGAPYVPVSYGAVVAPPYAHSPTPSGPPVVAASAAKVSNNRQRQAHGGESKSGKGRQSKHGKEKQQHTKVEGGEASERDSAAVAQVLLSLRSTS